MTAAREQRFSSLVRGVTIAAMIVAYGWFLRLPGATWTYLFVVGAALQLLVIVVRRLVPAAASPQAQELFELIADGATVLVFALGVYGSLPKVSDVL